MHTLALHVYAYTDPYIWPLEYESHLCIYYPAEEQLVLFLKKAHYLLRSSCCDHALCKREHAIGAWDHIWVQE